MALWGGGKAANEHSHEAGRPTGNCSDCRRETERIRNQNRLELSASAGLNDVPKERQGGGVR